MRITLPFPPSANRYWRSCRGRVFVSSEAKDYRKTVAALCAQLGIRPLDGNLCFVAVLFRPQKRGDLDNRLKILLDCLQGNAFENDSQITEIHLTRHDDKANPRVEIAIHRLEAA